MSKYQKELHDIRKPLNTISMQAELIRMLIEPLSNSGLPNEKLDTAALKIIAAAKECSEQLQDLFEEINNDQSNQSH
ncbi:histidine kinase [Glaciecola sp. MH2013]|uniref:histidine kinase dimerization/phospho-acceptor domain-containing protein n=1 Tax=Glaciecola sp. MH2013 TaxID=2785524 RepID=UPI00189CF61A|nr:histidine kinase dimerization/phospho-acceptor domain-containing protein [Glaciecola sp. MH2013]MBF7073419.1 histidine kinase [Glaciecola sp. MH2013]